MALKERKRTPVEAPDGEALRALEDKERERQAQSAQRERELSVIDSNYLLEDEEYNRERIEAEIAVHG